MVPLVLIIAVASLPILLAIIFRVSSVMLFFAIATGALLQRSIGESTALALAATFKHGPVNYIANIGLLILPVVLTLLFLRKSAKSSHFLLQLVPLIAADCALTVLLVPLLPGNLQQQIYDLRYGNLVKQSQDLVVMIAAVLNLLLAFRIYRHQEHAKHGKH
jgi:hypothetical protein